jgi:hypothetical protein
MTKPDGGPAFPVATHERPDGLIALVSDLDPNGNGMTLRDYFAGQALAGLLASPGFLGEAQEQAGDADTARETIALCAYRQADFMLAEREKGEDG